MKNYIQPGKTIRIRYSTVTASSGDLIKLNDLIGIAVNDSIPGGDLTLETEGVFYLPKVLTDNIEIGQKLSYLDGSLTGDTSAGPIVAVAIEEARNGSTHIPAKLLPNSQPSETNQP